MAGKQREQLVNQHTHPRIEGDTTIWNLAMVVYFLQLVNTHLIVQFKCRIFYSIMPSLCMPSR
ncbi:hypothetical protein ACE6H2_011509 [Prunus campanulata]